MTTPLGTPQKQGPGEIGLYMTLIYEFELLLIRNPRLMYFFKASNINKSIFFKI